MPEKLKKNREDIVALYKEGMPLAPLADKFGVCFESMRGFLVGAGVEIRDRSEARRMQDLLNPEAGIKYQPTLSDIEEGKKQIKEKHMEKRRREETIAYKGSKIGRTALHPVVNLGRR